MLIQTRIKMSFSSNHVVSINGDLMMRDVAEVPDGPSATNPGVCSNPVVHPGPIPGSVSAGEPSRSRT